MGYYVNIYDLLLAFGLNESEVSIVGASIPNWQMISLLLGGILWRILEDKKGRLSVLFGSILTYYLANIACEFVQGTSSFKLLRFIAGVGLAGELGAGVTLVSEILPIRLRAIGNSLVAGIGHLGAVAAYFTTELQDWRPSYLIGALWVLDCYCCGLVCLSQMYLKN